MIFRVTVFILTWVAVSLPAAAQWQYYPLEIPMRDGKSLAADVYTMDLQEPKPVILIQTPYNKAPYRLGVDIPQAAGGAGFPLDSLRYNYVIMDWRGRFASKDAQVPGQAPNIGEDGYDAVEWIAARPWCDGKIGTWGPSALGQVQFMTAKEHPPHLVCSVPLVKDYKTKYHDYYYGGVFRREHVLGLSLLGFGSPDLILQHPAYDNTWKIVELTTGIARQIEVPMFIIGGWYDHFPDGVIRAFHDLRGVSAENVRDQHKLLFGPWIHGACVGAEQGILSYPNADSTAVEAALRFFGYHLLGAKNGWPLEPPVRYYQLGANEWRSTTDWYSLAQHDKYLYFHAGGMLSEHPLAEPAAASYTYNPRNPSPSIGAARFTPFDKSTPVGPHDQATVEARDDNLIFTTPVLDEDLEVNGPVTVELFVSSDRTDTDFAVRLCDVFPDGRSIIMTDGIKRARFRNALSDEELMEPGSVYPLSVELQNLALTFEKGHRLRLIITSSDFPRFDLNTNTGGEMYVEGDTLVAENSIHFGGAYPSRIILPQQESTSVDDMQEHPSSVDMAVYPNPAINGARVRVSTPRTAQVLLRVVDALGRVAAVLHDGRIQSGTHEFLIPAGLPPGLYMVTATDGRSTVSRNAVIR